jgi:8-oxo-dGTP pyrophosphatase MutT (NUDIX family)
MVQDYSFGIVPLQRSESGIWEVFLVQHKKGYWSLPKGHQEKSESPLETAKRELFEETGLTVDTILLERPLLEHYHFVREGIRIDKTVGYYLATVTGEVKIQMDELLHGRWVHLSRAEGEMTYPEGKGIIRKALALVMASDR